VTFLAEGAIKPYEGERNKKGKGSEGARKGKPKEDLAGANEEKGAPFSLRGKSGRGGNLRGK